MEDSGGIPGQDVPRGGVRDGEAETKLSWWWSRDDERFYGPNSSRADAIMDAWADDPHQGANVRQAASGEWSTDIIDAGVLAEAFDDANEERADPDGDPASVILSDADWTKLAERLNRVVHAAIREVGLTSWGFAEQRPSEWVDIPKMWAAAEAADTTEPQASPGTRDESLAVSKSSESGEGDRASRSQPKSTLHGAHTDAEPSGAGE